MKTYPDYYWKDTSNKKGDDAYHYLATMSFAMDKRKNEIDKMATFMSPLECPSGLIPYLAEAIDVGVDAYEPIEFQRTITNNAVQYYTLKGTKEAYKIRGLMSGFEVEVVNLWHVEPYISDMLALDEKLEIPPGSGFWLSKLDPTHVSGVSGTIPFYGNCEFCLTGYVGVNFTLVKAPTGGFPLNILDRIVTKIKEIMPIHVRELYIELNLDIEIDMSIDHIECFGEEESWRNVGFNYRYDLWPADVVPCDTGVNINGTTEEIV